MIILLYFLKRFSLIVVINFLRFVIGRSFIRIFVLFRPLYLYILKLNLIILIVFEIIALIGFQILLVFEIILRFLLIFGVNFAHFPKFTGHFYEGFAYRLILFGIILHYWLLIPLILGGILLVLFGFGLIILRNFRIYCLVLLRKYCIVLIDFPSFVISFIHFCYIILIIRLNFGRFVLFLVIFLVFFLKIHSIFLIIP